MSKSERRIENVVNFVYWMLFVFAVGSIKLHISKTDVDGSHLGEIEIICAVNEIDVEEIYAIQIKVVDNSRNIWLHIGQIVADKLSHVDFSSVSHIVNVVNVSGHVDKLNPSSSLLIVSINSTSTYCEPTLYTCSLTYYSATRMTAVINNVNRTLETNCKFCLIYVFRALRWHKVFHQFMSIYNVTDRLTDGQADRLTDGRTDGWTGGRAGRQIGIVRYYSLRFFKSFNQLQRRYNLIYHTNTIS